VGNQVINMPKLSKWYSKEDCKLFKIIIYLMENKSIV